jgi:hypothetical protein
VVAWKVNDKFSIAAGPEIIYAQGEFKQGILVPGDEFKFKGDDVGYSFTAGMRWQPLEQLAFGVTYRYLQHAGFRWCMPKPSPAGVPAGTAAVSRRRFISAVRRLGLPSFSTIRNGGRFVSSDAEMEFRVQCGLDRFRQRQSHHRDRTSDSSSPSAQLQIKLDLRIRRHLQV